MRVVRGFPRRPGRGRAVALGVFDGLHRGHVKLLAAVIRAARAAGLPAAVVTFDDHPHGTLAPDRRPPRLATDAQRRARLQALGIDEVFVVPFTPRLAATEASEFVRRILVGRLGARRVIAGEDFAFGRGAAGDAALLRALGREHGFGVTVVPAWRDGRTVVSSTRIRALVAAGEVARAARWLGWPYALHGRVVRGEHLGSEIGLPTANLQTVHEIVPAPGVYAVAARLGGRDWLALCHIGRKPTFHAYGPETIEVHVPGWRGPLYGRRLEIRFLARLRGVRAFRGVPALLAQVARDWAAAVRSFPGLRNGRQPKIFFLAKAGRAD